MSLKFIQYGLSVFVVFVLCLFIGMVLHEFSIKMSDDLFLYIMMGLAVGFVMMVMGVLLRCYEVWKYKKMRVDYEAIGYCIIKGVLNDVKVRELIDEVGQIVDRQDTKEEAGKRKGGGYAIRDLLEESTLLRCFSGSEALKEIGRGMLGVRGFEGQVKCVKAIFFDKNEGANWMVPWHQDLTVCVHRRHDFEGYGPWSVKEGVDCVQPPREVLEGIVTLRIHLDDCDEKSGALKVVPSSHRSGVIDSADFGKWRDEKGVVSCNVKAGDVLVMKPLVLHSSQAAEVASHRRVIHLEYAAGELGDGICWYRRI